MCGLSAYTEHTRSILMASESYCYLSFNCCIKSKSPMCISLLFSHNYRFFNLSIPVSLLKLPNLSRRTFQVIDRSGTAEIFFAPQANWSLQIHLCSPPLSLVLILLALHEVLFLASHYRWLVFDCFQFRKQLSN